VTTAQGATEYDLYRTEGEASQRVSVPPQVQLVRYTAPIARRAAAQARLELPATAYSTIFRLYVGSALPVIDYPGSRLTTEPWGRVLHGWSPRVQDGRLLLPPIPAWEQGGAATFALAAAATAMALALSAAEAWLLWRLARWLMTAPESRRVLAPFRLAPFCGFFVPLALMWLVFLGAYYPGAMSADSIDQWRQTRTMDLNTVHPAFHTLTIKTITLLWRSPAAVALVQILGLSLVCAWAYSLLLRAGVPRMAVFAAWATTLCSLRNGTMAVTLWKDNFYAIAVFGFILAAAQCLLDAPSREKRWPWAALGAALALMPLYRHNGLPLSVLLFPALVWTFWPRRKKALLAGAAALLVYLSATEGLYPLFHVRRSSFAGILLERRLSMLRDQDAPFSQEELSRMRELQALPEFWVRRPGEAPPPVPDPLKLVWAPVSPPDARALTLWVIQRCPLFFLRAQIWMNGYLYWPAPLRGDSMAASWRDIKKNEEGLAMRPLLPGANRALNALAISTAKSRWAWLIWRPALPLYCTALALAALLWRLRDWRWLILYLPGLLNSASVFLLAMSAEQRYQFPLTLAAGFLVCLALLPKERRE
ncbi:MAG: hypothetical protein NTW86_31490, partial [Candidatus Sumerlaeota bacterium]|nr:hypothetical protein [Candidatus Sumerlaeota bacterium]